MHVTDPDVIISTTDSVPGYEVKKYVGVAWASSARTLNAVSEIGAVLRGLGGGDLPEFRKLLNEGRQGALHGMAQNAHARGANAVIGARLEAAEIVQGTLEIYAYGTAVVVEKKRQPLGK